MYVEARFVKHERVTERGFILEQEQIVDMGNGYKRVITRSEPKTMSRPMLSREKTLYRSNIISKPGRIPYDKSINKIAFKNQIDTPAGYKSIQSQINIGPGGTVDPAKLQTYLTSARATFTRINHYDVKSIIAIPPGVRVAYITKDNMWRSGGYYVSAEKGAQSGSENFYYTHILYKGFNNAIFSLQFSDIHMLYIKFPVKKVGLMIYKDPGEETNYPVYIKNRDGKDVVLSYCITSWFQKRMYKTQKYAKAQKNGWQFENGTQIPSASVFNFVLGDSGSDSSDSDSSDDSDSD